MSPLFRSAPLIRVLSLPLVLSDSKTKEVIFSMGKWGKGEGLAWGPAGMRVQELEAKGPGY